MTTTPDEEELRCAVCGLPIVDQFRAVLTGPDDQHLRLAHRECVEGWEGW